jgi:hypothetical protein
MSVVNGCQFYGDVKSQLIFLEKSLNLEDIWSTVEFQY